MLSLDSLFDDEVTTVPNSGIFAEAGEALATLNNQMNVGLMKIDAYTESVEREYALNIAQCELKCMKENGTADDLAYLEEAAEEGALAKLKAIIDKIIRMFRDFVSQLRDKVVTKITSAESRRTIAKAEKRIKVNPIVARRKMEVMNIKKPLGIIKSYKSKVDKITAKTVKGLTVEQNRTTLMETKENFRSEFRSSIAGKAAMTLMTVGTIVATLDSEIEKLPSFITTTEKEHSAILERLKGTVSDEAAAAATAATQACANFRTELVKEELNQHIDYTMSLVSALKSSVMKAKGNSIINNKAVKESADDDLFGLGDLMEESDDSDFLTELDDLFD